MGIFTVIKSAPQFFETFKEGKELADSATWKNRTVATNCCVAFMATLIGLAKTFGYDIALDDQTVQGLAVGAVAVVGAVNAIMHVVTSSRVGVQADTWVSNAKR
jgi:hypothetical protein